MISTMERKWAMPLGLVLAVVFVGLNRLLVLLVLARFPPNLSYPVNGPSLTAFWEFWFVHQGGFASVQRSLMVVNVLLVVFLWVQFRGLPRRSFGDRTFQIVSSGGAAALLAYLQYCLMCVSRIEPAFRLIRLELDTGALVAP